MKNSASCYGSLMSTYNTMNQFLFCNPKFITTAFRACKAIWPTHFKQIVPAIIIISELQEKLLEVLWVFFNNRHGQIYSISST
jgi:hypothetical protein